MDNLENLLRTLSPVLNPGTYVFVQAGHNLSVDLTTVVASVREPEGLSLVMEESAAASAELATTFRCAWITLTAQSSLSAVGFTTAFASALSDVGISANVIAGLHHDHLFVPIEKAAAAMAALTALSNRSRTYEAGAPSCSNTLSINDTLT